MGENLAEPCVLNKPPVKSDEISLSHVIWGAHFWRAYDYFGVKSLVKIPFVWPDSRRKMQLPTMYDVVPMIVKPATAKTKGGRVETLTFVRSHQRKKKSHRNFRGKLCSGDSGDQSFFFHGESFSIIFRKHA